MEIKVNMNPLEATTVSPYLGLTITYNNNYLAALYINLRKYQRRWVVVAKVLGKIGESVKSHNIMYKAVVQVVILYESKNLMVTDAIVTVIEGFHVKTARIIAGMSASKGNDGE